MLNMISETEFSIRGHGVHTAYLEITNALKQDPRVDVEVNGEGKFDVVHIQTMGLYAMRRLLTRKSKVVVSAHLVPESFIGSLRMADRWTKLAAWYMKFFYSRADLVLACSGSVQEELIHGMKLKNVGLLYNSIDMSNYHTSETDKEEARRNLGIPMEKFVIMGNGQIQPRKRFDLFHKLAQDRPDLQFIWVGGIPFGKVLGAEAGSMQKLMDKKLPNLLLTGVIELEDVKKYYQASDIFILPAEQENHPMCVLEAAGAGLPIILRDITNYQDTFKGGAIMVKRDEDFVTELDRLVADPDYYTLWQQNSSLIRDRFDSKNSASHLIDIYYELLK